MAAQAHWILPGWPGRTKKGQSAMTGLNPHSALPLGLALCAFDIPPSSEGGLFIHL